MSDFRIYANVVSAFVKCYAVYIGKQTPRTASVA
jgi:hypothetical protein